MASSARIEQWIFTGGSASSSAMAEFLIASASSSVRPRTHSVTSELDAIAGAIPAALDALALHGRLVVMSYQSLEDRIVKRVLTRRSQVTAPPDMPVLRAEDHPELALLTRGAEKADETEIAANPRAASVRLRAAERVREAA